MPIVEIEGYEVYYEVETQQGGTYDEWVNVVTEFEVLNHPYDPDLWGRLFDKLK